MIWRPALTPYVPLRALHYRHDKNGAVHQNSSADATAKPDPEFHGLSSFGFGLNQTPVHPSRGLEAVEPYRCGAEGCAIFHLARAVPSDVNARVGTIHDFAVTVGHRVFDLVAGFECGELGSVHFQSSSARHAIIPHSAKLIINALSIAAH